MIDRENVIKAVECRRNVHKRCGNPCKNIGDCEYAVWARDSDGEPYYPCCCDTEKLCDDILFLLKEQEAEIKHLKRPDCEHAEHDGIGCLGYCGCTQDDEPIESCKRCEKYTGNVYEVVNMDD